MSDGSEKRAERGASPDEAGKSEEGATRSYKTPEVTTYTEAEIFEMLGPARTYSGLLPTEL